MLSQREAGDFTAKEITKHIMDEHREVEGMLEKLSKGYDEATFSKLRLSLKAHMDAEEASLYPAMEDENGQMIKDAIKEHNEVRDLLQKMSDSGRYGVESNVDTLTEMISKHVSKEESDMLPKAKEMFSKDEIEKLSEKFESVDERVMQQAK